MNNQLHEILKSKNLIIHDYIIKVAIDKKLSLTEFLILCFFDNNYSNSFDIELVSQVLNIDINTTMEAFNSLMIKGLVTLESVKDIENRLNEVVKLDGLYDEIINNISSNIQEEQKVDIFKTFESELGRTISSMELELINGWLSSGTPEEIILGALREAVYNGVTSFRYIDKIIYEWEKKGFKTMDDVKKHMKTRREEKNKDKDISKKEQEISDYDWIDEK
ncbi:MAG TPA: hypothetical protein DCE23_05475 [Firmicutes bacterium]|nr:hypothetical protein [Bacillota bacterium]